MNAIYYYNSIAVQNWHGIAQPPAKPHAAQHIPI